MSYAEDGMSIGSKVLHEGKAGHIKHQRATSDKARKAMVPHQSRPSCPHTYMQPAAGNSVQIHPINCRQLDQNSSDCSASL